MNGSMVRALLQDALQQVLDNRIFRLLMIVVLGLVAPTFLVGFREGDVRILWGWQELSYDQLFSWIGLNAGSFKDVQGGAIQRYQSLVVDGLCGNVGMVFCVAATAFFVPRMLEKGSADVLFSKPLSRTTLLLARYVSGILFVGILATCLVVGMFLGFLLVSGYADTGFLWGAWTLVYLFAIVHGVSTLAGVFTRSTVAATLIALVFFMGTGCVHTGWRIRAYIQDLEEARKQRATAEAEEESDLKLPAIFEEEPGTFTKLALLTIDTLHYTLPKTSDADIITSRLRRAVQMKRLVLEDEGVRLTIQDPPDEFVLVDEGLPEPAKGRIRIDLSQEPVVWRLVADGGEETARIEVSRRSRVVERPSTADPGGRPRTKRLSASAAAAEWTDRAKAAGVPAAETTERKRAVDEIPAVVVGWVEDSGSGRKARHVAVLSVGDWLVEISETADPGWESAENRDVHLDRFLDGFHVARERDFEDPDAWFERRFAADAPLPFNLFFSIGSSIAFTVLMLVLASWKLSRVDF